MDRSYMLINTSVIVSTPDSTIDDGGGGVTNSEAVRRNQDRVTSLNSTSYPQNGRQDYDYHANAHIQAIVYIVIILVLYFSALTIIVVRYMRKERNQFHLPRYLLKKDRSPPSPTVSSSFRVTSGRRAANIDNSITAEFTEVAQCLNTVSNQLMMDKHQTQLQDPCSALLVPCPPNQVQIDTTSV